MIKSFILFFLVIFFINVCTPDQDFYFHSAGMMQEEIENAKSVLIKTISVKEFVIVSPLDIVTLGVGQYTSINFSPMPGMSGESVNTIF